MPYNSIFISLFSSVWTKTVKNDENLSATKEKNKKSIKEEENFEIEPLNQKESKEMDDRSSVKDSNERRFVQVLHDITLEINPGSLVGVTGAIGSGKSSLISSILGEVLIFTDYLCKLLLDHDFHVRP